LSPSSEVLAAYELERLMHRAAATRFERVPSGFVCANAELPMVWDASRVQVEPDCEPPTLDELLELAERPASWHPELRHREVFLAHSGETRELAYSLARHEWHVTELWLLICRLPPRRVPAEARPLSGNAMRRLKGRLGVEQGLPPASVEQFDRYDDLRARAAARLAFGGFHGRTPLAMADMYLRGDIAVIEDVATQKRGRGRGLATAAVLGATAQAMRVSARAVYLFAAPEIARGLYEPLGFEQIGRAWECQLHPPDEAPRELGIR
jgi:ribosomal protein S18 acetylase RimI-like enzyme